MIERQFVIQKKKEFEIEQFITQNLKRVGLSHIKIQRTPLGEKIMLFTSKPGLVVGRAGQNIKNLTEQLKKRFNLENPQIEINEVKDINLNPNIVAERIASALERYGSKRFKAIIHRALEDIMKSGALGAEIIISGKIPSARARSWRVAAGYLRKCGEIAITQIRKAKIQVPLKTGVVGVKVSITPPDIELGDRIEIKTPEQEEKQETSKVETQTEKKEESEEKEKKRETKQETKVVKKLKKQKTKKVKTKTSKTKRKLKK